MVHLSGSLVDKIEVKCECKLIYEIFKNRPHHIPTICPLSIHNVSLNRGQWGTVGSVITWTYFLDGQKRVAKEIIEEINDEFFLVKFKVIEGDITQLYKTFSLTVEGEAIGEDHFVKWTLIYEKLNESVPDPHTLMQFCLDVTKDIDAHHTF